MKSSSTVLLIARLSTGPLIHSGTLEVPTPSAWKDVGEPVSLAEPPAEPPWNPKPEAHTAVIHSAQNSYAPRWKPAQTEQPTAPHQFRGRGSYRAHARDKRHRKNRTR